MDKESSSIDLTKIEKVIKKKSSVKFGNYDEGDSDSNYKSSWTEDLQSKPSAVKFVKESASIDVKLIDQQMTQELTEDLPSQVNTEDISEVLSNTFKSKGLLGMERILSTEINSSINNTDSSPTTNPSNLFHRLEERIQNIELIIGRKPILAAVQCSNKLNKAQDPYGYKRNAAEMKLYNPLNIVELGEIEKVTSNRAKPSLQTSVLLLRRMFQKFADKENTEESDQVNIIDLIIHISLCEYRLYRQYPMIPDMVTKLRKVLPVIDNSHYLDGYVNSIEYKARKIISETDNIIKYINLMDELQTILPILDDNELVSTLEQADRMTELSSEVDELIARMRKLDVKIQADLLRFEVANKIHKNVITIKSSLSIVED